MNSYKKKVIFRTIALIIGVSSFAYIFAFDTFYSLEYSPFANSIADKMGVIPFDGMNDRVATFVPLNIFGWHFSVYVMTARDYNPLFYFMFWTHLSGFAIVIWTIFAWVAIIFKYDKLERIVNNQFLKNFVFSFIITTGIIFGIFAYIPFVAFYFHSEVKELPLWYCVANVFATTCKHVFIPLTAVILVKSDPLYSEKKLNLRKHEKSLILLIIPIFYVTSTLIYNVWGGVDAPYGFLDIGAYTWLSGLLSFFIMVGVAIIYGIISYMLFNFEEKSAAKEEKKEMIRIDNLYSKYKINI